MVVVVVDVHGPPAGLQGVVVVVVVVVHGPPAGLQDVVVVVVGSCKGPGGLSAIPVAMKKEAARYTRAKVERTLSFVCRAIVPWDRVGNLIRIPIS